jgi:hypothetical protein
MLVVNTLVLTCSSTSVGVVCLVMYHEIDTGLELGEKEEEEGLSL